MTIPSILGHGVLVFGLLLAAFMRPGVRRHSAARQQASARRPDALESFQRIPLDRLPDSCSLAGMPLRILLSDRSGPGALLRDTLMTRPSTRDL
jgi:hypothetical protein